MTWYDKTYVIIAVVDITQDMINECVQTSMDTLRKNNSETDAILKWYSREETPASLVAEGLQEYTNAEIKVILNDPENDWIMEVE